MNEYIYLTPEHKNKVQQFIENNIDTVCDEWKAYGTCIAEFTNGPIILDSSEIKDEFIESEFVGYWCSKCREYVAKTDDSLIIHVLEHIKGESVA